ncbi:unnamed protein product [Pleuronectes platessa]|uniref:Uncharacterized protein n=1 Tax=Pleuronectes platessa TaxID=8262 RepID=A0A9N7ZAN7_PLEPL|nr:unnamed protein product [Pleuronectes platessa]
MFIFVVKPLGTCRSWGSSRSVALLSAPPEAQGQCMLLRFDGHGQIGPPSPTWNALSVPLRGSSESFSCSSQGLSMLLRSATDSEKHTDGVAGAGAFFLLDRGAVSIAGAEGGPLEGTGYAVSGGHSGRVSGPSRGSPQLRRPLGEPSGWRLAAD